MAELTRHEKWLFSLTASDATTVRAQRAAIKRCGLEGMSRQDVHYARQDTWQKFKRQPENEGLPGWLVAARMVARRDEKDWQMVPPPPTKVGTVSQVWELGRLAHDTVNWGRLQKHRPGKATPFRPRTREIDNGRTGWDKVTDRYRDYLCVLSPDGKTVAVQIDSEPIKFCSVFRGRFLFRGVRYSLPSFAKSEEARAVRAIARLYRMHGLEARVVRQIDRDIRNGSGTHSPEGKLVIVIPDGIGGFYHPSFSDTYWEQATSIFAALNRRRQGVKDVARAARLAKVLEERGDRIFVAVEDSLKAGNCDPGTQRFLQEFTKFLGAVGPIGAATAKSILSYRNDSFTRRACMAAALRYGAE